MKHIAGIDLSTTITGVMRIRTDGTTPDMKLTKINSSPVNSWLDEKDNKLKPSLLDRSKRLESIAARVVRAALEGYDPTVDDAPLFVIESPLYNSSLITDAEGNKRPRPTGNQHDRSWVWGLIVHSLFKHGFVVEIAPTKLKSYATGKGTGRKVGVLGAMPFMFPDLPPILDDNLADAAVLAAMGARQLGVPVEPSPQRINPAAMNRVQWPSYTQLIH